MGGFRNTPPGPGPGLANCALTWYESFDIQLRTGCNLTLGDAEAGNAYTLSLSAPPRETRAGRARRPLCSRPTRSRGQEYQARITGHQTPRSRQPSPG